VGETWVILIQNRGSPAVPESVHLDEAAVLLHCGYTCRPTLRWLTVGEVLLDGPSVRPRDQLVNRGRGEGRLGRLAVDDHLGIGVHGIVHIELGLRLVLERLDETLGRHLWFLVLNG